jgi:syntaxin 6
MSIDPYHAVQQEIQSSLHTAAQLQSSFLRIRSMANTDSEELMWARNEVRSSLSYYRVLH